MCQNVCYFPSPQITRLEYLKRNVRRQQQIRIEQQQQQREISYKIAPHTIILNFVFVRRKTNSAIPYADNRKKKKQLQIKIPSDTSFPAFLLSVVDDFASKKLFASRIPGPEP